MSNIPLNKSNQFSIDAEESLSKQELLAELKPVVTEIALVEEGRQKAKPAKELLDALATINSSSQK